MQSRRAVLRPSCSAVNAYNSSIALYSAFFSNLSQSYVAYGYHRVRSRSEGQRAVTYFSTNTAARQESEQATVTSNEAQAARKEKSDVRGTYLSYESLTDRLALLRDSINKDGTANSTTNADESEAQEAQRRAGVSIKKVPGRRRKSYKMQRRSRTQMRGSL